ncbi:MAG TPA: copper homeostasis protein CutC, partial [Gemmatimonadaceae bacterium]|nr:copper homeostasis protein CutC [Gemmatimonadaceae bacterium]
VDLGVDRVLTSGGAPTALDGLRTLRSLVAAAAGRVGILAGGRVTAEVASTLVREAGLRELHVRGAAPVESPMRFRREAIRFGKPYAPDEYRWSEVSEASIRAVVDATR